MTDREARIQISARAMCAFCGEALAPDDRVASIRMLSHAHDCRYLGAHVECLMKTVQARFAQQIDLTDIPPGVDHFLALPT